MSRRSPVRARDQLPTRVQKAAEQIPTAGKYGIFGLSLDNSRARQANPHLLLKPVAFSAPIVANRVLLTSVGVDNVTILTGAGNRDGRQVWPVAA
jgi:hypothetical protein